LRDSLISGPTFPPAIRIRSTRLAIANAAVENFRTGALTSLTFYPIARNQICAPPLAHRATNTPKKKLIFDLARAFAIWTFFFYILERFIIFYSLTAMMIYANIQPRTAIPAEGF
jgi:hypothetical protein